ncbi:MAG: permease [Candidatus Omnitrophota bacterium]|nr:MAG: permease [Candidatus Omnitrophota bacterium]
MFKDIIFPFLKETINLWLQVSPYLLFGLLISGIIHIFMGKKFIGRHLGKGGISSIIKATILGVPLPVCSCAVIPLASSLKKEGAHKSSVLSFLVSTPTTGVDSVFATYSLLGPLFAVFRLLASFLSGVTVGVLDYFIEGKKEAKQDIPKHSHSKIKASFHLREFLRYSLFEVPQDIGRWLFLGTVLGGAISAFLPAQIFEKYFYAPWDFLVALVVGVPLYVCATGSIPVAASLIYKGFSPGAGLVFLIVGPATNVITLSFVRAKLGKKSFYLYLASVTSVALILGGIFNYLWRLLGQNYDFLIGAARLLPFEVKLVSGIVLLALVVNSLIVSRKSPLVVNLEISVPDIHCKHCRHVLEDKLIYLEGVEKVFVNIEKKTVQFQGMVDRAQAIKAIKELGYHPHQE